MNDVEIYKQLIQAALGIDVSQEIDNINIMEDQNNNIPVQMIIDDRFKSFKQLKKRCFEDLKLMTVIKKYSEGNY